MAIKRDSAGFHAVKNLKYATDHAMGDDFKMAAHHRAIGLAEAERHVSNLKAEGKQGEVENFQNTIKTITANADEIINGRQKRIKKSLVKSADNTAVKAKAPKQDGRYHYKPFHAMTPEAQLSATHAFGERDMSSYHYPHDIKTGDYVHSTRWKPKGFEPPKANEHTTPMIAPEHKPGAGVRINNEASPYHGKLAVVQHPNPEYPGQIHVRVQDKNKNFTSEFMQPHQVVSSKLARMTKSELALKASKFINIQKAKKIVASRKK